jgi:hypothetical protein
MTADISGLRESPSFHGEWREKELIKAYQVFDTRSNRVIVDARVYMGRSYQASTVYALLWVSVPASGSGAARAGGYGYDKISSAIGYAIRDAGIKLSSRIEGVGTDAIREALRAIANATGVPTKSVLTVETSA